MWVFIAGMFVGAVLMAWVFADGAYEADQELECYKRQYGYSYSDLSAAWRNGRDGGPPVPPRPQ